MAFSHWGGGGKGNFELCNFPKIQIPGLQPMDRR